MEYLDFMFLLTESSWLEHNKGCSMAYDSEWMARSLRCDTVDRWKWLFQIEFLRRSISSWLFESRSFPVLLDISHSICHCPWTNLRQLFDFSPWIQITRRRRRWPSTESRLLSRTVKRYVFTICTEKTVTTDELWQMLAVVRQPTASLRSVTPPPHTHAVYYHSFHPWSLWSIYQETGKLAKRSELFNFCRFS